MTTEAPRSYFAPALWLLGTQLLVSVVAAVLVSFEAISIPHCELRCDFATLSNASEVFRAFAAALMLVSITATVTLRKHGRWILAPSLVGLLFVVVGAAVATHISRVAMLF